MLYSRVEGYQQPVVLLFVLELLVGRNVGYGNDLAVASVESQAAALHYDVFVLLSEFICHLVMI